MLRGSGSPPAGLLRLAEQGGVLVHYPARDAQEIVLGPLAEDGQAFAVDSQPEERVEGERRSGLDGRRGGQPRAERHVAREGGLKRANLVVLLPHRPDHAARVIRPGVVFSPQLARLVEIRGVEAPFSGAYRHGDAAVDGAGEHEAAVVVGVLADQVYAAWGAGNQFWGFAELLGVSLRRSLFRLSQSGTSYSS